MESIDFFHQIVREKSFKNTTIILLLNKADLFREKIKTIPIKSIPCFHDYAGGNDFDAGVAYFVKKYKERLPANVEVLFYFCVSVNWCLILLSIYMNQLMILGISSCYYCAGSNITERNFRCLPTCHCKASAAIIGLYFIKQCFCNLVN